MMKGQWNLILALIFALIVAVFSVINVEAVKVRYFFGEAYIPLIIVILASTLAGGVIVGTMGLFRQYKLQKEIKALRQRVDLQLGADKLEEIDREENEEVTKKVNVEAEMSSTPSSSADDPNHTTS